MIARLSGASASLRLYDGLDYNIVFLHGFWVAFAFSLQLQVDLIIWCFDEHNIQVYFLFISCSPSSP